MPIPSKAAAIWVVAFWSPFRGYLVLERQSQPCEERAGGVFHGLLPSAVDSFVLRANVADFNAKMELIVA